MKNFILYIVLCSFLWHPVRAQCNIVLSGKILDRHSKNELDDAHILLLPDSVGGKTDRHGNFMYDSLCPGTRTLVIRHAVCPDTAVMVELKENQKNMKIYLNHYYHELDEIDISVRRPEYESIKVSDSYEGKKLDEQRGGFLAEIIQKTPGVSIFQTGPTIARPMIHGMQGYRVLLVNNHIRHEAQQWGNEHAPEIDPFVYDKTEVIKGSGTLRYGSDAVGGVIASHTSGLPDTSGLYGELFSIGHTNGRGAQLSGKLQGRFDFLPSISWRIQGSFKKAGDRRAPYYFITNSGNKEWNGSYEIQYKKKNTRLQLFYTQYNTIVGIFSGSHIGNLTDLANVLRNQTPVLTSTVFSYSINRPYQTIHHEMIKFSVQQDLHERWAIFAHYAFQYNARSEFDKKHLMLTSNNVSNPELDYRVQTQQAEIRAEHLLHNGWKGQMGAQALHQINNSFGRFFIPNYIRYDAGIFFLESYQMPHWTFEAGTRFDYRFVQSFYYQQNELQKPIKTFDQFSFQGSASYAPLSFVRFILQGGNAWRAPAPNELYSNGLHHGVGAFEKGNPNLDKEASLNGNMNIEISSSRIYFKGGYFIHDFKNFIFLQPTGNIILSIQGAFPEFAYTQSAVRIHGLEANYTFTLFPRLEWSQSGMILRGYHKNSHNPLIYMPSDRIFSSLRFYLGRNILESWIELQHQWVDKQTRVPPDVDFAPPPAAFHLWNASVGLRALDHFIIPNLFFIIQIFNLFNVAYRDYLDRFRYFTDLPGRNIFLKLKIPFGLKSKPNKT